MMDTEIETKLRIQEISLKQKKKIIKKRHLKISQADVHRREPFGKAKSEILDCNI